MGYNKKNPCFIELFSYEKIEDLDYGRKLKLPEDRLFRI